MKLTTSQQAWATIEAEAFAVIWSLRKYRNLTFEFTDSRHILVSEVGFEPTPTLVGVETQTIRLGLILWFTMTIICLHILQRA